MSNKLHPLNIKPPGFSRRYKDMIEVCEPDEDGAMVSRWIKNIGDEHYRITLPIMTDESLYKGDMKSYSDA